MTDLLTQWLNEITPGSGLTPSQHRVEAVIVGNQQLASYSEISAIASRAMVNASTVVRYAKALGFRGWPDLQNELRGRYLAGLTSEETLDQRRSAGQGHMHTAVRRDIENLQRTLVSLDVAEGEATIAAFAGAKRIIVLGLGSMSGPAVVLSHLGAVIGYPVSLHTSPGPNLAAALAGTGPGDVLVVVNVWRPMRDVVAAQRAASQLGATVVAITDMRRGSIAANADHVLAVSSEGVSFFSSVTAATSVVYGLLGGMEAAQSERSRSSLRRTQQQWDQIDVFTT